MPFKLVSPFQPAGDQPEAIKKLVDGFSKFPRQTLLGITGSGKTFTMAHIIARLDKPTLVLAHNKTLAAQLYSELKGLFPENRVEYFVSYYDYYQPESYLPSSDTYIEKDSKINPKIEALRLKATASLASRKDVIIVSSVSCIYGLGSPKNYKAMSVPIHKGQKIKRDTLLVRLLDVQYERNDMDLSPGKFRVRGDVIDLWPAYEEEIYRIELFGDQIDSITIIDAKTLEKKSKLDQVTIYPARHYVISPEELERAIVTIKEELDERLPQLGMLEAHRLAQRTKYDIEMIQQLGFCSGIENYSRHFEGRQPGKPPFTLLDFFPDDFLMIIDESHQTIPQLHGMYHGDFTRKKALVDYGFRLPSAHDNRPLKFEETERYFNHVIFVSATPAEYELKTSGQIVEQIIRPTGLLDPEIEVRPMEGVFKDVRNEIKATVDQGFRVLITTLTKRMAEDLTDALAKEGVRVRYLHSEIDTLERNEIIRQLRLKKFDVLVGINLLREGLDIPEVALVCILDADKEGFLRNERSLIQTIGRAARNEHGKVILYAEKTTDSMRSAINITTMRRARQIAFNKAHGITPRSVTKTVQEEPITDIKDSKHLSKHDIPALIVELESKMKDAAEAFDFEQAIRWRDRIEDLKTRID
ncbi:MAG: excinuclease ABC subunit UvrB [Nanoarchaeota archaeon]